ncbi:hypothetical protein [uncultured Pontibacter sp.]|uniref:hypothetical protein n=1 Tax=uncultured Pontibacter sp. TaxID=453356 RepID=UPI002618E1AE|nr:hypothetical protein [uncultured Pontibacter sp.]
MKNQDNFHEKKSDSGHLGEEKDRNKVSKNPAPKGTAPDRESETTPPDHEVYVDLEPDELHIGDEEDEIEDVSDLRKKDQDKKKKK